MAIVSDLVRDQLRDRFGERLREPVEIRLYIRPGGGRLILPSGIGCPTCGDARELAAALAAAAPELISLVEIDITQDPSAGVEEVPTLTLGHLEGRAPIHYQGLPSGVEFATVVDAIERLSTSELSLSDESLSQLEEVKDPVEIMIFTSPTCRYCPQAVSLANRLALASDQITSVIVSAHEFPALSRHFGVQGVPHTVVNRRGAFPGALPEPDYLTAILELVGRPDVS